MAGVAAARCVALTPPPPARAVGGDIARRLLTGEIAAGARLAEAALAEDLGVSRGPVREAMRGLIEAGLVHGVANRGVVVRKIGLDEALDLYDLRGAIFGCACETLAQRKTSAQVAALEAALERMAQAIAAGDKDLYYQLNIAFHAEILEFCGNRRARSTYEAVVKEMHLFRRRGLSRVSNIEASLAEHRTIVDAIRSGDADAAFRAGREHVRRGRGRFVASLDEVAERD